MRKPRAPKVSAKTLARAHDLTEAHIEAFDCYDQPGVMDHAFKTLGIKPSKELRAAVRYWLDIETWKFETGG